MHIYCKNCNKHTGNTFPKKLILISKYKIKWKSKCAIFLTEITFIDKIEDKYDLESKLEIYFQFFEDWCYKDKMKTYCVKCKKDTDNIDAKIIRTRNGKLLMQSKCTACGIKKWRFIK